MAVEGATLPIGALGVSQTYRIEEGRYSRIAASPVRAKAEHLVWNEKIE
jgi:hypothetical protein